MAAPEAKTQSNIKIKATAYQDQDYHGPGLSCDIFPSKLGTTLIVKTEFGNEHRYLV